MPDAIELYERLRPKMGDEEAAPLIRFIEEGIEKRAVTKEDLLQSTHRLEGLISEGDQMLNQRIIEGDQALKQRITEVEQRLAQRISRLEVHITEVEHRLQRRIDRTFYVLLAAMLILNGDKIIGFISTLVGIFK
jgi:hypothetical protein